MKRVHMIAAGLAMVCMAPIARPEPPTSLPPGEQVLRGPDLPDRGLVQFDFPGNFVRLLGRPEVAVIGLLEVDPERSDRMRRAAEARIMELGFLLVDNIDLVRDTTDAIRAGDAAKGSELARVIYDQLDPAHARDPLLAALGDALTPAERDRVTELLDEYWNAWIAWELRDANDRSDEAKRQAREALSFRLFQEELQQAYRTTLRPYAQKLERIYQAVEPTEEQRAAIRDIMIDYIRETRLTPSEEERQRATSRVYSVLDEERRERLVEYVLWRL